MSRRKEITKLGAEISEIEPRETIAKSTWNEEEMRAQGPNGL